MPACCVPLCKNSTHSKRRLQGISFYRFPVDLKQCQRWIRLIRRKDFEWTMESRICSWHFPSGKDKGPIRFHWNEKKSFMLNGFSTATKRDTATKQSPMKLIYPEVTAAENEANEHNSRVDVLEVEATQLKSQVTQLEAQVKQLNKDLISARVDSDLLRYELKKATIKLPLYKSFEHENVKLKKEVTELKMQVKDLRNRTVPVSKASFLEGMANWEDKKISSFTGLLSFSSLEILFKLFKSNSVGISENVLNSSCQTILFLMKFDSIQLMINSVLD